MPWLHASVRPITRPCEGLWRWWLRVPVANAKESGQNPGWNGESPSHRFQDWNGPILHDLGVPPLFLETPYLQLWIVSATWYLQFVATCEAWEECSLDSQKSLQKLATTHLLCCCRAATQPWSWHPALAMQRQLEPQPGKWNWVYDWDDIEWFSEMVG